MPSFGGSQTQVVVDAKGTVSGGIAPVQILFCLKEQSRPPLFV